MTTLRVMICGKSRYGYETYLALRDLPGVEIVAGAVSSTRRNDRLRLALEDTGTPFVPLHHLRRADTARFVEGMRVDLIVLANVTTSLHFAVRKAAHRQALCFHPSLLPAYRGKDAVTDQVRDGVTRSGVSIFVPSDGWDEGPLVKTYPVNVPSGVTPSELYHDYLVPIGVKAMVDAVADTRGGYVTYTPQHSRSATGTTGGG